MGKLAFGSFTNMTNFNGFVDNFNSVKWPIKIINLNKITITNHNNRSFTLFADGTWEFHDSRNTNYTTEQIAYYINMYMPELVSICTADGFIMNS